MVNYLYWRTKTIVCQAALFWIVIPQDVFVWNMVVCFTFWIGCFWRPSGSSPWNILWLLTRTLTLLLSRLEPFLSLWPIDKSVLPLLRLLLDWRLKIRNLVLIGTSWASWLDLQGEHFVWEDLVTGRFSIISSMAQSLLIFTFSLRSVISCKLWLLGNLRAVLCFGIHLIIWVHREAPMPCLPNMMLMATILLNSLYCLLIWTALASDSGGAPPRCKLGLGLWWGNFSSNGALVMVLLVFVLVDADDMAEDYPFRVGYTILR